MKRRAVTAAPERLQDLRPDPNNLREHTERNIELVTIALETVGAARSVLTDGKNMLVAGHATTIAAQGVDRVQRLRVVDSDGTKLIAVRRRGLSPEAKQQLSMLDNRAAELARWNAPVLATLSRHRDLSRYFYAPELESALAGYEAEKARVLPPESTDAAHAENPAAARRRDGDPDASPMALIALYMSEEEHTRFHELVERLSAHYGSEGVGATVLEAVARAGLRRAGATEPCPST